MNQINSPGEGAPGAVRVCTRTVMDTTDPDITFDEQGVCNWWHDFHAEKARMPGADEQERLLEAAIDKVKRAGHGKRYDCVLGLSGGVDSSYLAWLAKEWGLRPLVLHFDNGWNDEMAVANIETIVRALGFRLETFVMNWPEFRDLQRSYFKASVMDLEVPTDHLIFGALYNIAQQQGIKCILSGNNFATEWLLPRAWYYSKGDAVNLTAIHAKFGEQAIKNLPVLGGWRRLYLERIRGIESLEGLNLIDYKKTEAKRKLESEFGWRDYGGKHYESVFTRLFQGYILPKKFGIDKRKAHLSNLILNGEITREHALAELQQPTDDPGRQSSDKRYVAKKLNWSENEFEDILSLPPVPHEFYGTNEGERRAVDLARRVARPFARLGRAALRA
jgi:N-acetyl sugar amidotransferase